MKRIYAEPELEIRKYKVNSDITTVDYSDPSIDEKNDLGKDDESDYFGG